MRLGKVGVEARMTQAVSVLLQKQQYVHVTQGSTSSCIMSGEAQQP